MLLKQHVKRVNIQQQRDRVLKNHGATQHSVNINFIKYLTRTDKELELT